MFLTKRYKNKMKSTPKQERICRRTKQSADLCCEIKLTSFLRTEVYECRLSDYVVLVDFYP